MEVAIVEVAAEIMVLLMALNQRQCQSDIKLFLWQKKKLNFDEFLFSNHKKKTTEVTFTIFSVSFNIRPVQTPKWLKFFKLPLAKIGNLVSSQKLKIFFPIISFLHFHSVFCLS